MKKVLLVPDSFKGTMSSREICAILEEEVRAVWPSAVVESIPVADGGEGSVDTFLEAVGGQKYILPCQGPYGEEVSGFFGLLPDGGRTAVVEMAAAAGLPLAYGRKNPEDASTYGVGQLMAAAHGAGARRIIVGLGGSATNDGGCGAAAALGVRFYRADGTTFIPTGKTLRDIASLDASDSLLQDTELVYMSDIDNPLCGETGAAAVFGPQKGADEEMVASLDAGLRHLAEIIQLDLGVDILEIPGAGAAGGMGGGLPALLGGELRMGIDTVLDLVDFDRRLKDTDLVLTGEGKIDSQSLRGKVVIGVARRCRKAGVPAVALVGNIGAGAEAAYDEGIVGIFSINRVAVPMAEARERSREDLRLTARNLLHYTAHMTGK